MHKTRSGPGSGQRIQNSAGKANISLSMLSRFPTVEACVNPGSESTCRQTQCRYHLEHRGYWEHRLNPTRDCSLTVANEGEHTLDEVAEVLGVSTERVRQIEERAFRKLQDNALLRRAVEDGE
jgi:hypothetical protein